MKTILLALVTSLLSSVTFAQLGTTVVECSTKIQNVNHVVSLRLNAQGTIVNWGKNQIAKAHKDSIFGVLAENTEEWGFEYIRTFKAANGYSIVRAGTTADEISVGVSKDLKKGFYNYQDLGSGNGDSKFPLVCVKK